MIVATALLAVAVSWLAVGLLSPDPFEPSAPVAAEQVLGTEALERAEAYRAAQRPRIVAAILIELIVLALLVLGKAAPLRRLRKTLPSRPLLGGAVAGAAISLLLAVAALPVALIGHERAVEVGLSNQDLPAWLGDRSLAALIAVLIAAAGGFLLIALQRRAGSLWWLPGSLVVVGFAIVVTWLGPYLLTPLFNELEPLPEGRTRDVVTRLAADADIEIGEIYRVDASRRSRALNAYVDGLGSSKRVVVYDTALEGVSGRPLRSLLAHELAHVKQRDLPRGILFVALVAPFGLLFVRTLGDRLAASSGAAPGTAGALPAYVFALALTTLVIGSISNQLSRHVEAKADQIAIELSDDPKALILLQRQLARTNLSDPDPPGWWTAVFSTHPSPVDRVASARTLLER